MSQSFTNLLYHLVFSTKERRPLIKPDHEIRLYDYIGGIIRVTGGTSLGIGGTADHIHVLAKLRPDQSLSDVLRDLKANATGWMHDVFPHLHHFSVAKRIWGVHGQSIGGHRNTELHSSTKGTPQNSIVSR